MGARPASTKAVLVRENGRDTKKPLWADKGDGWADAMMTWRLVSIMGAFLRAWPPHKINTTRCGLALTTSMTRSVKRSQPRPLWLAAA